MSLIVVQTSDQHVTVTVASNGNIENNVAHNVIQVHSLTFCSTMNENTHLAKILCNDTI